MYSLKTTKIKVFIVRKHVNIFIIFIVFCGLIIYYNNAQNEILPPLIMHFDNADNNISCHYGRENDALPSAEDRNFLPRPNSIFFHETSCRGGLDSRQACAIESASRAHPDRQVYVMFSAPVSDVVYQRSCIAELRRLPNVRFARVHITDYAKNTPLEAMVAGEPFINSKWRVEHTSDVLRYLSLYKWGGVYLDTDMVIVKSLTPLGHNWVARQDSGYVAAGAMAFSMDYIGRRLAVAVINYSKECKRFSRIFSAKKKENASVLLVSPYASEVKTTYRPDVWIHNGPGVITRVLSKMCETSKLLEWSSKTCHGFEVYGPDYFYPVHYSRNNDYFKPMELKNVENAYTHHFWNKLTHDMKIEKDSPYDKLAQKFCPTIYKMFGEEFGS